jgi:hypothetical protein
MSYSCEPWNLLLGVTEAGTAGSGRDQNEPYNAGQKPLQGSEGHTRLHWHVRDGASRVVNAIVDSSGPAKLNL